MYTQCPHCEAIFRVSMKEITTAHGQLRCGECHHAFNAMSSLSSTLPSGSPGRKQTVITENPAQKHPEPSSVLAGNTQAAKENSYSSTPAQDRARKYMLWAGLGLVILLLSQALYVSRNWLAHQPMTANITRSICESLGCNITPKRDPTNIEIVTHNVYAHPNEPNSLFITATMRSIVSYEQPLPLVEISFLDKDNNMVAFRRFSPKEYSPKTRVDKKLFNPYETLSFKIKIVDPGKEAITFKFNFL